MGHKKPGAEGRSGGSPPWERHGTQVYIWEAECLIMPPVFSADPNSIVLGAGCKEKKTQRTRKLTWGGGEGLSSGAWFLSVPSVLKDSAL